MLLATKKKSAKQGFDIALKKAFLHSFDCKAATICSTSIDGIRLKISKKALKSQSNLVRSCYVSKLQRFFFEKFTGFRRTWYISGKISRENISNVFFTIFAYLILEDGSNFLISFVISGEHKWKRLGRT